MIRLRDLSPFLLGLSTSTTMGLSSRGVLPRGVTEPIFLSVTKETSEIPTSALVREKQSTLANTRDGAGACHKG